MGIRTLKVSTHGLDVIRSFVYFFHDYLISDSETQRFFASNLSKIIREVILIKFFHTNWKTNFHISQRNMRKSGRKLIDALFSRVFNRPESTRLTFSDFRGSLIASSNEG